MEELTKKDTINLYAEDGNTVLIQEASYTAESTASGIQVGGDHYKDMAIQPSEFIYKNDLNWLQGNAIKYICRHSEKGGKQDIDKAIHYLELLKEWGYEGE